MNIITDSLRFRGVIKGSQLAKKGSTHSVVGFCCRVPEQRKVLHHLCKQEVEVSLVLSFDGNLNLSIAASQLLGSCLRRELGLVRVRSFVRSRHVRVGFFQVLCFPPTF